MKSKKIIALGLVAAMTIAMVTGCIKRVKYYSEH